MSFDKSVKLITNLGTKPFEDFRVGQQIEIMDKDGIWREATIVSYNNQAFQKVTFTNGNKSVEIICTPRHEWILDNGYITTRLSVGQKIYPFCSGKDYHMSTTSTKLRHTLLWTVSDIEPLLGNSYESWSVQEPVTNSFTLANHIVTHDE